MATGKKRSRSNGSSTSSDRTKKTSPAAKPQKTRTAAPRQQRKRSSWGLTLVRWAAVAVIWGGIALGAVVAYFAWDLPSVDMVTAMTRRPSVTIQDSQGATIASYGDLYGDVVQVSEMPAHLPGAVMAIEDRDYYDHFGVDPLALVRAAIVNLRAGRVVQGGSTIAQQAAKNLFLSHERTLKRKVQELLLAFWLEWKFTKDQILTLYLNRVYLGAGTYGVEAAAQRYFGVSARDVTAFQSAVLAGLLKAPSRYNPVSDPEAAKARAQVVLTAMAETGVLTPAQAEAAAAGGGKAVAGVRRSRPGRYFADWVMEQLDDLVGAVNEDVIVSTTLDTRLQRQAEAALSRVLAEKGTKVGAGQGAVVVATPDGAVQAMVGGKDYADSQFNRATQALRQPGSAFKPFVYLAALEAGGGPDSVVSDDPITVLGWSPDNYAGHRYGTVTWREALARSLNTAAVRVSEETGRRRVIEAARRLGLDVAAGAPPSVALGTEETTLLRLTTAYASFANGGLLTNPYGITEVRSRRGEILYLRSTAPAERVIAERAVGQLDDMLQAVVSWGTGKGADIGRPAAGKTGTSQDYRDAWFVGFTPDYVAGVWVGNDDNTPMKNVTGGSLPTAVWREVMTAAHQGLPPRDLPRAPGSDDAFTRLVRGVLGMDETSSATTAPAEPRPQPGLRPQAPARTSAERADRVQGLFDKN